MTLRPVNWGTSSKMSIQNLLSGSSPSPPSTPPLTPETHFSTPELHLSTLPPQQSHPFANLGRSPSPSHQGYINLAATYNERIYGFNHSARGSCTSASSSSGEDDEVHTLTTSQSFETLNQAPRISKSYHSLSTNNFQGDQRPFGRAERGRHFCTYVDPKTRKPCDFWTQGYTNWSDLARHADSKHASQECSLILKGYLTFETAQWVTSQAQLEALYTIFNMICPDCKTQFTSGRMDSLTRHMRKGACERAQARHKQSVKLAGEKTVPAKKRKGSGRPSSKEKPKPLSF
ncbi:hypothetical protein M422DRAFT_773680 [Sphaerobolus stellatus SS14]|nr:hypothetical protein M422DRAFT_773680 [Sphaerobolus stellatus SS14]